ncbi:alanine racemase [Candidatus Bathyarchaeota archaeon]|nr:alanine racemase [Candidatus Bathyarchaeota archaeon]
MSKYLDNQPTPSEIREKMEGYTSWLEIDLDSITHNLHEIRGRVGVEVMAVVKNNAYGHGLLPVAAHLSENGVSWFMVAKTQEAKAIRDAGIPGHVVNMDAVFTESQFNAIVKKGIIQVVYTEDVAKRLSAAASRAGREAKVFVKVDTGLRRVGVDHSEAADLIERVAALPGVTVKSIFSTFMQNPEQDGAMLKRLLEVDGELRDRGIDIEFRSMASSDAVFHNPEGWLDMVRPGMSLYGVFPEAKDVASGLDLRQALALKARIEHVKWVEKGDSVTYWGRFIAPRRMRVGTLHVGFYDGVPREMANKGRIKVGSEYRGSLGSVSLNHYLLDLTSMEASPGDVAEVIGREGENSLVKMAEASGWMVYSLMNHLNPFTPRVYLREGKPVALLDLSQERLL